ncbi:MAG: peptide-methionine (S)-S-oxide reductase [Parcubacteria group bacterium Greene0714_7]|nr:MAG: peptide-methionine (S)-S-oxide reductase [Parcubacteria group bacterium Greene0714_7]
MNPTSNSIAVFGGGCFWCTEAVFKMLRGVISVEPGYAGGTTENPTYYAVSNGNTGHAEVIKIEFDPSEITYNGLLTVFFGTHDATQVNRQGNDIGTQYRSIILYTDETQKKEAEAFIQELNDSSKEGRPIATDTVPLTKFYPAEKEHLDYYARNKNQGYCQVIIEPKLQKVQEKFAELLKTQSTSS